MRVPVSWLRDYVPIEMALDELATRLSISTAEVEGIERRGVPDSDGNLGLFRVGKVVEAAKHPNADRLQLCRVDVGEGEPRSIVCGAWNFGVGATVGVALPGAVLPNGLQLDRREVRGESVCPSDIRVRAVGVCIAQALGEGVPDGDVSREQPRTGIGQGSLQSMGSAPCWRSSSLARLKGRDPKNPPLAESGEGCGLLMQGTCPRVGSRAWASRPHRMATRGPPRVTSAEIACVVTASHPLPR